MKRIQKLFTGTAAVMCLAALLTLASFAAGTVSLTDTVTSYAPARPLTVTLCRTGEEEAAYSVTLTGEGDGPVTQSVTVDGITPGVYDVIYEKAAHLSYTVTGVDLRTDLSLDSFDGAAWGAPALACGDINGDDFIDSLDVTLFFHDIGKSAADAADPNSDLTGDAYRDAVDATVLSYYLLAKPEKTTFSPATFALSLKDFDTTDEDGGNWWGLSAVTAEPSGAPDGSGWYRMSDAGDVSVICGNLCDVWHRTDLSLLSDGCHLELDLYIENASLLADEGPELYLSLSVSRDAPYEKTNLNWSVDSLHGGWNTVSLYLPEAVTEEEFSLTDVQFLHATLIKSAARPLTWGIGGCRLVSYQTLTPLTLEMPDASYRVYAAGDAVRLPTYEQTGYRMTGWTDGTTVRADGDLCPTAAADGLEAVLTPKTGPSLVEDAVEVWDLNDGGREDVFRSFIGAADGTVHWGTWLPTETFGFTLDFSVEGSYAKASGTALGALTDTFTVAAWVKAPVRGSGARVILSSEGGAGTDVGMKLYLAAQSGALTFEGVGLTGIGSSGVSLADGCWHHVAVTLSRHVLTYYVDGTAVSSFVTEGRLAAGNGTVTLGALPNGQDGLNGSLACVRIYDGTAPVAALAAVTVAEGDNTFKEAHLPLMKGIWIQGDYRQDIVNCRDMGFGHARVGFDPDYNGVVYINDDGSLNLDAVNDLTARLDRFVEAGLPVVVGPHPVQAFKDKWITDQSRFDRLVSWYGDLAAYLAARYTPDQIAFSIMSEPAGGPAGVSWTWIADRIISAMRNAAPGYTLLSGGNNCANIESTKAMEPMTDDNLLYQISTYEPYTIGFGTASTGMAGYVSFWNYLGAVPYPVPEGLTNAEIEQIVIETTAQEPAEFKAQAQDVVRKYLKGISDAGDYYVNRYGGVYNRDWHVRRWQSVTDWADHYGGAHVHLSECGTIDAVQSIQYFGAMPGSGATMETHYAHLRDIVETALDAGIGYDYCCYNNPELTIFDTRLRTTYGEGISSDLALSWYDYDKLAALHVTPVREYHPTADLASAELAIAFNDAEGAAIAASELLLGHAASYGTVRTVADPVRGRAASFDGTSGCRAVAENADLSLENGLTVSAWIKPDAAGNGSRQVIAGATEDRIPAADGVTDRLMINDCDSSYGFWGISPIAEIAHGDGRALITTAPDTVIFCRVFPQPFDVTGMMANGYLSIDVYCENASLISSVMVELYSETDAYRCARWVVNGPFRNGWNTVRVKASTATLENVTLTNITNFRFVGYCIGQTATMAIDDLCFTAQPTAPTNVYWMLTREADGRLALTGDGFSTAASSTSAVPADGAWHHVTASVGQGKATFWIDGQKAGETVVTGTVATPSSADIVFGADAFGSSRYRGLLSGVRVYGSVKTPSETLPAE